MISLQLGQILERIGSAKIARMDQAHVYIAYRSAGSSLVKERIFSVSDCHLERPFAEIVGRIETLNLLGSLSVFG